MFFELVNSKVVVTEQALMDESLDKLYKSDKSKSKTAWNKAISYLFFVYSKQSQYKNVLLHDRRRMVSEDIIKDSSYWKKLEEHSEFSKIIEKYNNLQFTHNERLLEGLKRKIEEYLNFWNSLSVVDKDNHKLLSETLKSSEALLELQERLERMVSKEALSRQVGDGESKIFEDDI